MTPHEKLAASVGDTVRDNFDASGDWLRDHIGLGDVVQPSTIWRERTADYALHNAPLVAGLFGAEYGANKATNWARKQLPYVPPAPKRNWFASSGAPLAGGILAGQLSDDPVTSRVLGAAGGMAASYPGLRDSLKEWKLRRTALPGRGFVAAIPALASMFNAAASGVMGSTVGRVATATPTPSEVASYVNKKYPWSGPLTAGVVGAGAIGAAGILYAILRRKKRG